MIYHRKIVIENDGLGLVGTLYEPAASSGRFPCALMLPGLLSDPRGEEFFERISRELAGAGMAAFDFHVRGTGESEARGSDLLPANLIADAQCALEYLSSQALIDPERLCALGFGFGGLLAAALAARDDRVRSIALLAPAFGQQAVLEGIRRRARKETRRSLPERSVPDLPAGFPGNWAECGLTQAYRSLPVPALVVHGNRDQLIPFSEGNRVRSAIEESGQTVKQITIEGGDHWFTLDEWQFMVAREIRQWFEDSL